MFVEVGSGVLLGAVIVATVGVVADGATGVVGVADGPVGVGGVVDASVGVSVGA